MIDPRTLAALPLFEGSSPAVVAELARAGMSVRYEANSVLFLAGSKPRGWYVILSGVVRVVRGSGDRQHVVHTETRGGTLAEVPLFTGGTHPATGIAAEPTECALFARSALESAIAAAPEVAFLMARRLAMRTADLVQRLHERSTASVQARLIQFLLRRHTEAKGKAISLGMTQQDLAEELGTVRAVVARELGSLVRRGLLVSAGAGRYHIPDAGSLGALGASQE
jgi:CRP/FNR family transcriptional regulator